jgi:hypothetical protein
MNNGIWTTSDDGIVYYWSGWEAERQRAKDWSDRIAVDDNKKMKDADEPKVKAADYGYWNPYFPGSWAVPEPKELTPEEKHTKKLEKDLDKAFRRAKY